MTKFHDPIRIYNVFNEARSDFAVSPERAEDIAGQTQGIITRYTGALLVQRTASVHIPRQDSAIAPGKVNLPGDSPHNVLLTSRYVGNPTGMYTSGAVARLYRQERWTPAEIFVSVPPASEDPENHTTAAVLARSIGENFYLGTCATADCLMQDPLLLEAGQLGRIGQSDDPLCGMHGKSLKLSAGIERFAKLLQ
jgi:hypothetical protein